LKERFDLYKNIVAYCMQFQSESCHFFQPSRDFWRTRNLSSTTLCQKAKRKYTFL